MASNEQPDNSPRASSHFSTYAGFTNATKWGSIFVITVLVALYIFLV